MWRPWASNLEEASSQNISIERLLWKQWRSKGGQVLGDGGSPPLTTQYFFLLRGWANFFFNVGAERGYKLRGPPPPPVKTDLAKPLYGGFQIRELSPDMHPCQGVCHGHPETSACHEVLVRL